MEITKQAIRKIGYSLLLDSEELESLEQILIKSKNDYILYGSPLDIYVDNLLDKIKEIKE